MKLLLKRIAKQKTYTIGKLYIDGVYECDTLEDTLMVFMNVTLLKILIEVYLTI